MTNIEMKAMREREKKKEETERENVCVISRDGPRRVAFALPIGDRWESSAHNLEDEAWKRLSVEGVLQCCHLVEQATKRPHVRLAVVRLVLTQFG
jgi:hypothetical protein